MVIAILTNEAEQVAQVLGSHLGNSQTASVGTLSDVGSFNKWRGTGRHLLSVGWSPTLARNGFYLTWAHKDLFRYGLASGRYTHFLYLEDDICFTEDSFAYWCRFRKALAPFGLLPGYVRFEAINDSLFIVDQTEVQPSDQPELFVTPPAVIGDDPQRFVQLCNPYQGMYIMDRPLAQHHLKYSPYRSPTRSKLIRDWDIRERAAAGPIFDHVPSRFHARNVIPVRSVLRGDQICTLVDPACLLKHLSGNYSVSPNSRFGKLRLENVFATASAIR